MTITQPGKTQQDLEDEVSILEGILADNQEILGQLISFIIRSFGLRRSEEIAVEFHEKGNTKAANMLALTIEKFKRTPK